MLFFRGLQFPLSINTPRVMRIYPKISGPLDLMDTLPSLWTRRTPLTVLKKVMIWLLSAEKILTKGSRINGGDFRGVTQRLFHSRIAHLHGTPQFNYSQWVISPIGWVHAQLIKALVLYQKIGTVPKYMAGAAIRRRYIGQPDRGINRNKCGIFRWHKVQMTLYCIQMPVENEPKWQKMSRSFEGLRIF